MPTWSSLTPPPHVLHGSLEAHYVPIPVPRDLNLSLVGTQPQHLLKSWCDNHSRHCPLFEAWLFPLLFFNEWIVSNPVIIHPPDSKTEHSFPSNRGMKTRRMKFFAFKVGFELGGCNNGNQLMRVISGWSLTNPGRNSLILALPQSAPDAAPLPLEAWFCLSTGFLWYLDGCISSVRHRLHSLVGV